MKKDQMKEVGMKLFNDFIAANPIPGKNVSIVWEDVEDYTGWYSQNKIHVDFKKCARISPLFSFPGLYCDRTPVGVPLHELGHWYDHHLDISTKIRKATKEPAISSYCPNNKEWFAEMFRLFATNSDLLRVYRPKTYNEMLKYFTPVVTDNWEDVILNTYGNNSETSQKVVVRAKKKMGIAA